MKVVPRPWWLAFLLVATARVAAAPADYFAIEIVDAATGRGIPAVGLETTHHLSFYTDSQGLIALSEPELAGNRVYFGVHAAGYEAPVEASGVRGVVLNVKAGTLATIKLRRLNVAERLYRFTGAGIYRDSVLLERAVPIEEPLLNGSVVGQDAVAGVRFRDHLFWFGGDTLRLRHPIGQYWTSGAISKPPGAGGLEPGRGVNLHYLVDNDGFARAMWPRPKEGVMWTDALMVVTEDGRQQLLAHYARMKSLTERASHGLGIFDDRRNLFSILGEYPATAGWHFPSGQATRGRGADEGYLLFSSAEAGVVPFPMLRAAARPDALRQPESFVAFTYLQPGRDEVERDEAGSLVYGWKPQGSPVSPARERELIAAGALSEAEALYQVRDVESRALVDFRSGSVHWNEYRQRWVLLADQQAAGGVFSGEVWYAESATAVGPWRFARRVATHGTQSFYNPAHFDFLDGEGGRYLYFGGTLANTSGAPSAQIPRYDYNQLMYRLDLADPRLLPPATP